MNMFEDFQWRGLIHDATPGLDDVLKTERVTAYIGFDPTASSLHIGSLLPIMNLARLQRFGHTPIAVAGGGTGLIGDPSGKEGERSLLTLDAVEENLEGIKRQLSHYLDIDAHDNPARIVNNAEWLSSLNLVEFLRDIGKHFSVNAMMARESVKRRLESQEGISFTEFCYMLLQAYDYLTLYDRHNCTLQMGGSDQWGNIVSGMDLIRRLRGGKAYGLVSPLVMNASGTKFGKTEAGTIWLDPDRTSPYHFYQYWLNVDDRDVITHLKYFTWLDEARISQLQKCVETEPETREAQRALAGEVTRITHGDNAVASAERITQLFFGEEISNLKSSEIMQAVGEAPTTKMSRDQLQGDGIPLVDLLSEAGIAKSKGEAKRLITGGGIYLNNRRCIDEKSNVTLNEVIEGQVIVLRKGQKNYHVVTLT